MNTIGVIPARMDSTRLPNKPIKEILGIPMIGHCYYRTALAIGKKNTYVATCDKEIYDYILSIGGKAIMTSRSHTRATTRSAEAMELIELETRKKINIVLMIQGDEPLINPNTLIKMSNSFDDSVEIVNIMSPIKTREAFEDVNNVKVVINNKSEALYFSREPIPSSWQGFNEAPRFMQTGIIGFRRDSLLEFNRMNETPLEIIESVDMNRALEMGVKVKMILSKERTIGVDVPEDIAIAEALLQNDPIIKDY